MSCFEIQSLSNILSLTGSYLQVYWVIGRFAPIELSLFSELLVMKIIHISGSPNFYDFELSAGNPDRRFPSYERILLSE